MVACENGIFSRVRELLEKGSDVNTQMKVCSYRYVHVDT
jgi:hypothetical protein